ncbi:helix-turn-helix transcriptional regulator [Amycolatopsis sp. A133]|uniref:helix-turn-helix transcriptional regulator n=1 Tax=Amycolatopsis sp. A133 TaxID=3064472 RepID=UPI0027F263B2|nr:helix-turn-helix transcriptional regulator [Amycolatopsis sp. A133]MDQ7810905.1 helix-turn-helix transcriptional regulator [Amycolatopsis sp. A133]
MGDNRAVPATARPGPPEPHDGRCPAGEALALLERGTDRATAVQCADLAFDDEACLRHVRCLWRAVTVLLCAGELVAADARLRRLETTCAGPAAELVALLRAQHTRLAGDLGGARAALAASVSSAKTPFVRRLAVPFLVDALAAAGAGEAADALLAAHRFAGRPGGTRGTRPLLLAARGSAHLVAGRFPEAARDYADCLPLPAAELSAHFAVLHRRGLAALAAASAGDAERAAALAAQEHEAALAWGSPAYVGWALYVRAVVDGSEATTALLDDAIDLLELARSRVVLAAAGYERGRRSVAAGDHAAAKREFDRAGEWARQIGNGRLTANVRAALAELAHAAEPGALTAQEAKIAELARAGYANKQIAEKLYLAVRTVEFHLSNVYRKLGISSRRELRDGPARLP